jgi:hypothetical protein
MAPKQLSEDELLAAPLFTLNREQIDQRMAIIACRKAEMEYDLACTAVEKHKDEVEERKRKMENRVRDIEAEREKTESEQRSCAHNTGGRGLEGILNGDGFIYGSSTGGFVLPTGELYFLCCRCGKEWHRPSKRAVIEGRMSLAAYRKQEQEFVAVSRLRRESYAPSNGEWCAASQFTIPKLIRQAQKDDEDFAEWLKQHDREVMASA